MLWGSHDVAHESQHAEFILSRVLMLPLRKFVGEPQSKTGDRGNSGCACSFPAPRRGILTAPHPTLTTQAGDVGMEPGTTPSCWKAAGMRGSLPLNSSSCHSARDRKCREWGGDGAPALGLSHPIYTHTATSQGDLNTGRAVRCCKWHIQGNKKMRYAGWQKEDKQI